MELVIHKLIEAQAEHTPTLNALRYQDSVISYAELAARGARVARGLATLGLREGDRIAYLGKNHSRVIELLVAASIGGFVLIPLNWRLASAELDVIVASSRARLLLTEAEFAGVTATPEFTMGLDRDTSLASYDDWAAACDGSVAAVKPDPDRVIIQLYTSGTTGLPKGVMLTHRNFTGLRDPAMGLPEWLLPEPGEVSLVALPLFHVAGIAATLDMLCTGAGATVILQREFDLPAYAGLLAANAVTRLCLVPAMVRAIIDHVPAAFCRAPRLRYVIYGASPMTSALRADALATFDAGLVQVYGLTETAGFVTGLDPAEHHSDDPTVVNSIGRPLPGVELKIADTNGDALPDGTTGEVWIRSSTVTPGYFERPEETAQALTSDGWLRTGDAAFIGPGGHVVLQDRIKNMIISGGENVYPAEVENAIASCPGVADVAVVGISDPRWGEVPHAFVVRRDEALAEPAVIEWAAARIARYKVPRSVAFIDVLPRNPSGKILHRVLRDSVRGEA